MIEQVCEWAKERRRRKSLKFFFFSLSLKFFLDSAPNVHSWSVIVKFQHLRWNLLYKHKEWCSKNSKTIKGPFFLKITKYRNMIGKNEYLDKLTVRTTTSKVLFLNHKNLDFSLFQWKIFSFWIIHNTQKCFKPV